MIKTILRRFMSLVLVMVIMITFMPDTAPVAYGAEYTILEGLNIDGIECGYDGDKIWKVVDGSQIQGSGTSSDDGCNTTNQSSTLQIKNVSASQATLEFNYSITQNGGSIKINNEQIQNDGTYKGVLAENETISIELTSGNVEAATQIKITDFKLTTSEIINVKFSPAQNGTYQINGSDVEQGKNMQINSTEGIKLKAEPNDGYAFLGWYNVTSEQYITGGIEDNILLNGDCEITAKFVKNGTLFKVGDSSFDDLSHALQYAKNSKICIQEPVHVLIYNQYYNLLCNKLYAHYNIKSIAIENGHKFCLFHKRYTRIPSPREISVMKSCTLVTMVVADKLPRSCSLLTTNSSASTAYRYTGRTQPLSMTR